MQIARNSIAAFHYTLTNSDGQVIDTSRGREPLAYLHGAGNIVPGLEKAMDGRSIGDSFDVEVAPEEGYGARDESLVAVVPRSAFQGVDAIEPGMRFHASGPQGAMSVTVARIEGDDVTIDGNHPLAGETLHFAIEVTDVREASSEELAHGHPHGEGGHSH